MKYMRYVATMVANDGSVQRPEVRANSKPLALLALSTLGIYVELISIRRLRESAKGVF